MPCAGIALAPGYRVAVGADGRVLKQPDHAVGYLLGDAVFQAVGLGEGFVPGDVQDVGQEAFGQPMPADNFLRHLVACHGQGDLLLPGYTDEAVPLHPSYRSEGRGRRHAEGLGKPR